MTVALYSFLSVTTHQPTPTHHERCKDAFKPSATSLQCRDNALCFSCCNCLSVAAKSSHHMPSICGHDSETTVLSYDTRGCHNTSASMYQPAGQRALLARGIDPNHAVTRSNNKNYVKQQRSRAILPTATCRQATILSHITILEEAQPVPLVLHATLS